MMDKDENHEPTKLLKTELKLLILSNYGKIRLRKTDLKCRYVSKTPNK